MGKSQSGDGDIPFDLSIELLKRLHILTRDGQLNQDSRRKLKQVNHLVQFIGPLLQEMQGEGQEVTLVDHGAGKSYLGFILYDRFFRHQAPAGRVFAIESRAELVESSRRLAAELGFAALTPLCLSVAEASASALLPERVDMVTALHACDTATDDAIRFALLKAARHVVLVPCCQAEVAEHLRRHKADLLARDAIAEIWRHPLHTREFASLLTNALRCLQLEAHGYQVSVTELVGWEHSLKNELIIARRKGQPQRRAAERLAALLDTFALGELRERFFTP